MAIQSAVAPNGVVVEASKAVINDLDASKVIFTPAATLKPLPESSTLVFGQTKTDHMLTVEYIPSIGWGAPQIRPYANLELDPMSSCFQYCPNVFEGMKAYLDADGTPCLFRPNLNMARMVMSAARMALPPFNPNALLELIKELIRVEKRWIPKTDEPGYSLYIRPTIIGTRPSLGVSASDSALLYVVLCPTGPYFKSSKSGKNADSDTPSAPPAVSGSPTSAEVESDDGPKGISLLAVSDHVRAWPGGTGGFKLGLNYAPGFAPQRHALAQGYDQVLWLLANPSAPDDPKASKLTEVGAMNVFVIVKRDDDSGELDAFTPPLDGTILPGLTRASVLELLDTHNTSPSSSPLALPSAVKVHTHQTNDLTMSQILDWSAQGRLLEVFGVGTAVVVAPVARIGFLGEDLYLPGSTAEGKRGGLGVVGKAVSDAIMAIQTGKKEFEGWCVRV
ncbi:branched-chain amino acid aminotransferase II [Coprinopsis marcescibilis]|uniref:branched-chain-amino-acid transaminase n=1 Tax=Coprinopsis marcescibilis TaxID=230819 RepID=A0A5C3KG47_COPMA|nr:branched-chain amino acid aminotransferase II [Coprinopsis marcescibilis]